MSSAKTMLTSEQASRYSRHLLLNQVGVQGQEKLLSSSVLIIGAGGLGSPIALYLAAAGVGTIGIIDGDEIDLSNLQRQILFSNHDVGRKKAEVAAERIQALNPDVQVIPYVEYLTSENASSILSPFDLVINGSDNFTTRYLVNDLSVLLGKPLVDASVVMFEGQAAVYMPGKGCYRCLYPHPPEGDDAPTCSTSGVLGALVGQMGTLQAMEALKILLGIGETLDSRLLYYDALSGQMTFLKRSRNKNCPVCGDDPQLDLLSYDASCLPLPLTSQKQKQDFHYTNIKEVEIEELLEWQKEHVSQIIDLREVDAFEEGHISDSVSIPYQDLLEHLEELDPKKKIVLVCAFGRRSKFLQLELASRGIENTWSLAGGILEWERLHLPLV